MLNKAKTLAGYKLRSLDGEIGNVEEFYFDDHHWTIRYLIANTGNWLTERQVLISPYELDNVNNEEQHIAINLTKKQIENSPSLDSDIPVSQQFEESYNRYYGLPTYWSGPCMWGTYPLIMRDPQLRNESSQEKKSWNPHLRSTSAVSSYDIQASDGEIGHVEDFVIDAETWAIRYLVIDTQNWWPGGKDVLISPKWIERVSWDLSKVFVNLSCDVIKQSPEYTADSLLDRNYETALYQYYNRPEYWEIK